MSTGKTTNYQLNQWDKSDLFQMDEFNADNRMVDEVLKACAWKHAAGSALASASDSVTLNLSELGVSPLDCMQVHLFLTGWKSGTVSETVYLTMNGRNTAGSYLACDRAQDSQLSAVSAIPVGKLCPSDSLNRGGLEIVLTFYQRGILVESRGIYADASGMGFYDCVGMPSRSYSLSAYTLKTVELFLDSANSAKFNSASVELYTVEL